jgi:hypothetical protein
MTIGRFGKWTISAVATAASTYALDGVAAAAGIFLVATGLLRGLGHPWLVAVLVASYAAWALGLRAGLRANWTLLVTTGTSTNVLSKAAYAVTAHRTANVRTQRIAAHFGYAGTEVAKEVPYYAGAFDAVLVTDSITSDEALVFLCGANLGAAVYEYGLARLIRVVLSRRGSYASFDTDWVPSNPSWPAAARSATSARAPCSGPVCRTARRPDRPTWSARWHSGWPAARCSTRTGTASRRTRSS